MQTTETRKVDPVLRWIPAAQALGVSRATLVRWVAAGRFPRPIPVGPGARGWRLSTIEQYLEDREREGDHAKAA